MDAAAVRPKKRALIVEDDAALVRVLRDNLEYEGFDVQCATTGQQAMSLARSSHPDVVLLDVTLPDSSGFDLLETIRHDGRTAIIMLTARSQKSDKLEGLIRGARFGSVGGEILERVLDLIEYYQRPYQILDELADVTPPDNSMQAFVDILVNRDRQLLLHLHLLNTCCHTYYTSRHLSGQQTDRRNATLRQYEEGRVLRVP